MLSPFECLCGNFILPEPASYVFFYALFHLRNLLYIVKAKSDGIDSLLKIVRGRTEITELTPTIIREFVDKIYVHQAVDFEGQRIQQIDIAWNFIGVFDPPESDIEAAKGKST